MVRRVPMSLELLGKFGPRKMNPRRGRSVLVPGHEEIKRQKGFIIIEQGLPTSCPAPFREILLAQPFFQYFGLRSFLLFQGESWIREAGRQEV